MAEKLGCRVFNVDFSLAPENMYPAAIEDICAAIAYIYENADSLKVDKEKIGMFGDSAGCDLVLAAILDNKSEAVERSAIDTLGDEYHRVEHHPHRKESA